METADDAAGVQVRRLAPPRRPNAFTVVVLRHHPQQPAAEDALLLRMDTPAVARVTLSEKDKAQHVQLTDDGLGAQSSKGYRTVRCTHGVATGAWYFEVRVVHLGPTGHARIGWATSRADVNAPVGCDTHGYAYRSGGGEKVHNAVREAYGAAFGEGDVVGVYLSLGATSQRKEVVRPAGQPPSQLFTVERERRRAGSSAVAFAVNGVAQSVAYTTVVGEVLFPAASLFTEPSQAEPASLRFNFGPDFQFPPPEFGVGLPAPQAITQLVQPKTE